jgi:hypothetical protein
MSIRSLRGNREISPLTICHVGDGPHREDQGDVRRGEKSDSLIVAAKQANNPKGAESVERRSGARERGTATHAPDTEPESMSQRLSRVREAAKQRKKERFTALFHLLTVEALEAAFSEQESGRRSGWHQVDGLRRHEEQHNRSAPEAIRAATGRSPAGVTTSQKRMENNARSASPRWRTRSSSMRW